jgi:hypothetical protein
MLSIATMGRIIISILLVFASFQSHSQIAMFHAHNTTNIQTPLLLDSFGTNVKSAVSFRKIRLNYTGYCLRIQRLSDNATRDIGFVNNYLDSADIISWMGGSGNAVVAIWYDQSTVGNNLIQISSGVGPVIYQSGNYLNYLMNNSSVNGAMAFVSPPFASVSQGSVFTVTRMITGYNGFYDFGNAASSNHHPFSDDVFYDDFLSSTRVSFAGYGQNNLFITHSSHNNGSTLSVYKNGTQIGSAQAISFVSTPTLQYLFTALNFHGNVAAKEFIVADNTKTSDRAAISLNQKNYFNL